MSKAIRNCFSFVLLRYIYMIGLINIKNSRHIINQTDAKTKTNHDLVTRVFPGCMYLLRVLIGSLFCLRLLWLAIVISLVIDSLGYMVLVLALRHSPALTQLQFSGLHCILLTSFLRIWRFIHSIDEQKNIPWPKLINILFSHIKMAEISSEILKVTPKRYQSLVLGCG